MKIGTWFLRASLGLSAAAILGLGTGCQSQDPNTSDVSSDYRTQTVKVAADTKDTTEAAKSILEANGLKNIHDEYTGLDGLATAEEADGTTVKVKVEKTDAGSKASVTIGTLGDPKMGKMIAEQIKGKAEGK